jgi:hypothetical protein
MSSEPTFVNWTEEQRAENRRLHKQAYFSGPEILGLTVNQVIEDGRATQWRVTQLKKDENCVALKPLVAGEEQWFILLHDGVLVDLHYHNTRKSLKSRKLAPLFKRIAA